MARIRLHHEPGPVEDGALSVLGAFVFAAFIVLVAAATIYDVGDWFAIW